MGDGIQESSPKSFVVEANSVLHQSAAPAEEQGAAVTNEARDSHPLDESVAFAPSFEEAKLDTGSFGLTADQTKCPVVIDLFLWQCQSDSQPKSFGISSFFLARIFN